MLGAGKTHCLYIIVNADYVLDTGSVISLRSTRYVFE